MRVILGVVAFLAAILIALIAAIWVWQERMVWLPPRAIVAPDTTARRLEYAAEDGQRLFALLVGDPATAGGLLIAFHGNADLAVWQVPWAVEVARRTGWSVLLPEYRGYGDLPGTPTYEGSRRDGRAAWELARHKLGVDSSRIALYGHSLGSAVATEVAVDHPPAALVLVSPLTSARDVARGMPLLPHGPMWGVIGRVKFDTRAKVATLDAPVWVAHGELDTVLPAWMGQAVHDAARRRGELLLIPGAGHNDIFDVAGERYWAWLRRALGVSQQNVTASQ